LLTYNIEPNISFIYNANINLVEREEIMEEELQEKILDLLKKAPQPLKYLDICKATGASSSDVITALSGLEKAGNISFQESTKIYGWVFLLD